MADSSFYWLLHGIAVNMAYDNGGRKVSFLSIKILERLELYTTQINANPLTECTG